MPLPISSNTPEPVALDRNDVVADVQVPCIRWLPTHLLTDILDRLDWRSRRCFGGIDRHAHALDAAQRRADWLVATSRWAGTVSRLAHVCQESARLPVPLQPRVLHAVILRAHALGHVAAPVLRTVIDSIKALPPQLRDAAVPSGGLVDTPGVACLVGPPYEHRSAHRWAAHPVPDPHAPGLALAVEVRDEVAALMQQAEGLVDDLTNGIHGALARLREWSCRVGALMPPSARVPPLKACAAAARYMSDPQGWRVLKCVIEPLTAQERADILAAAFEHASAGICFDVVLGLVADLPHVHRDALLAQLVWQIPGLSVDEQGRRLQSLISVAESALPAVCVATLIALVTRGDMLHTQSERLVFAHANRMLRQLPLSQQAELVATVGGYGTLGARLWALSRLPELAQRQAACAVPKPPACDGAMPLRAEIVRRLIVGMTGPDRAPPPVQLTRVWPALYVALKETEKEAGEFAQDALRELAPQLPDVFRAQANALLSEKR